MTFHKARPYAYSLDDRPRNKDYDYETFDPEIQALHDVMDVSRLTQAQEDRLWELLNWRNSDPPYDYLWDGKKSRRYVAVCICGHALADHAKVGTEYCRCEIATSPRCNCATEGRVAIYVAYPDLRVFRKKARGTDQPHALNAAVKRHLELTWHAESVDAPYIWMIRECDECHTPTTDLHAVALDHIGRPMIKQPKEASVHLDTGQHKMLCTHCYDVAASTRVTWDAESLGMDKKLINDLLRKPPTL